MDRKELVLELKKINNILNEKAKKESEVYPVCWDDSDYEKYMDKVPVPPTKPVVPQMPPLPTNEGDRFLKDKEKVDYNSFKTANQKKPVFFIDAWSKKMMIIGAIVGAIILVLGFQIFMNGNNDLDYAHRWFNNIVNQSQIYDQYVRKINDAERAISLGVIMLSVGGGVAVVPVLIALIASFIYYKKDEKALAEKLEKDFVQANEDIEKLNIANRAKREKALNDYILYEKQLLEYNKQVEEYEKNLAKYNANLDAYNKEYSKQLQLAKNKVEAHNKNIKITAENEFKAKLKTIKVDFPENYYYAINSIITILEDCRADNLKEAINVFKIDEHNEKVLYEQRRLVEAQEEYRQEQEEKEERIRRIREGCRHCTKRFKCTSQFTITEYCEYYSF